MPARHSHRSIRRPFTHGLATYLLNKEVVIVPGTMMGSVITYNDNGATRHKVALFDADKEAITLFVSINGKSEQVLFEYQPRHCCWRRRTDYSYFDIQTAPTAQTELPAPPPQAPAQTESSTEALAEMIALIHEEMQNARGEIVLRNLDRSALLEAKSATEYLHRLIALSLELADLRASDLSRKDIQAVVDRALKDFKDHIEDPRISSS
jgi:hypothetical protein